MNNGEKFQDLLMYKIFHLQKVIVNDAKKRFFSEAQPILIEQVPVIMILDFKGSCTQQEIANDCDRDKSSVLRTINSLQQKNLVMSATDPFDGRKKLIKLTKEGQKIAEKMKGHMAEIDEKAFRSLTAEERAQFEAMIAKCEKAIGGSLENDFSCDVN